MIFTADDIQARLRGQPFEPMRIVTTTGQTYDIYHPDLIVVGRRSIFVGIPSEENPSQYDSSTYVALVHITELRALPIPVTPGS